MTTTKDRDPKETETRAPGGGVRLVVFAWGNTARGDDGLGPLLLEKIEALDLPNVVLVEDFQLQIEHALDLEGADLALFVDASVAAPAPFSFVETGPRPGLTHTSHAMAPEAVLDVAARVLGRVPPPAFVLGMRGEAFELGTSLGPGARAHLEAAFAFLKPLLDHRDVARWRATTTADAPSRH